MIKRLVPEKAKNLLLYSEVTKDYPFLIEYLKNCAQFNDDQNMEFYSMHKNFFDNILTSVIEQAKSEWETKKLNSIKIYERKDRKICQICNYTPLINVCTIENRLNKNCLEVGLDCVEEYRILGYENNDNILKSQKKVLRQSLLNESIPGIGKELRTWNHLINNEDQMVLKRSLIENYCLLKEQADAYYYRFLKPSVSNKEAKELILKLKDILVKKETEVQKINDYVEKRRDNPLFPSQRIFSSIDTQGKEWLLEEGSITPKTLFRINNNECIRKIFKSKESFFKRHYVELIGASYDNGVEVKLYSNKNINLNCDYRQFCYKFGKSMFEEKSLLGKDFEDQIIEIGTISDQEEDETAIWRMSEILHREYRYKIASIFYDFNDVYIVDHNLYSPDIPDQDLNEIKAYYQVKRNEISEIAKKILFEKLTINGAFSEIKSKLKNPMSKADYNYLIGERQKQKY
ncbi:hypothetical protein [Acetobacterium woodii]|uniref:Uncharacterized protein n=1 Tax=Acetobacterium woodii (strain ATCC 29683 / DSM 1030 / JCM 2381 / KCTC 1655 / WB1) TaxID=931626 RepID=H6LD61_ACEWD|nr:hypothetical protein [Acetobacterium woodii]AFA47900.1 hypothetical protein Awo_c11160 [Acetobacterium woodii DSM 1030]